ncbi:ethanolamine ammonia-lyase subunit EutC [Inquilinus sp. YAF38]|uniref:ethanolamine ammonia-lyase subunit EutC n=1 Tax=Inquilinus sp. YAF38 TaxID=3233084 RepID=UPI003F925F2B
MSDAVRPDPWARLRAATRARIGLGRSGDALPTAALLDFQLAHARARDAVQAALDLDRLQADLAPHPVLRLHSAAPDRATYLRRPDLGRRLDPAQRDRLEAKAEGWDIAFVVADGLSAAAVQATAAPLIRACAARLAGWSIAPVAAVLQGRVALGDEVGAGLGARLVAVLIGERPGLSVAASTGIYLTWAPRPGRLDSERNCISNIHADGLGVAAAADKLCWLAREAARRGLTGVTLKDDAPGRLDHDTTTGERLHDVGTERG